MEDLSSTTVSALLRLGALPSQGWDKALEEILRVDASLLDVDRVSYWTFRGEPLSLVCELGLVRHQGLLERGTMLPERDGAEYVEQMRSAEVFAVEDVRMDPRLGGISRYLEHHEIGALLDVPVFQQGELVGVLCHEHVGGPREWKAQECELALGVCQTLSARLEARARSYAEQAERRSSFLSRVSGVLAPVLEPERAAELAVWEAVPELGEIATLIGYDGTRAWRVAQAHADPEARALLEQLVGRYGADIEGPGLGVQALRDEQSLLLPTIDVGTLRREGLDEGTTELIRRLRVRSGMAVLLRVRGAITGVLTFASTTRSYDRHDLRFAEAYARQVGVLLSNVQLYARAQAAVRARDEFLSLASHELRTPLASLTLSVQLLARGEARDAPVEERRALASVVRQTKRLSRLSELMLAASQVDGTEMRLRVEPIDLAALVRGVVADLEDALASIDCELRVAADTPVSIHGDAAKLEAVVSHLLDNAIKFGAGCPVDVSVHADDGTARVVVRDRGRGLSDEQRAHLGRRFERGVSAKHFGGMGLGLFVSSRIVDAHGGSIGVESRPGEGATFTVELPREPSETK